MRGRLGWHDASSRVRGPAVARCRSAFRRPLARGHRRAGSDARAAARRRRRASSSRSCEPSRRRSTTSCPRVTFASSRPTRARCARRASSSISRASFSGRRRWSRSSPTSFASRRASDFRVVVLLPAKPNNGADTTRGQLGVLARGRRWRRPLSGDDDLGPQRRAQRAAVRSRQGRDRRRRVADDRVGQPQRALVLQRHRDERRDLRSRPRARDAAAALGRASGALGRTRSPASPVRVIDELWRPIAASSSSADSAATRRPTGCSSSPASRAARWRCSDRSTACSSTAELGWRERRSARRCSAERRVGRGQWTRRGSFVRRDRRIRSG